MTATIDRMTDTPQDLQDQHEMALQQSLDQERLGYMPDVEVTKSVVMPRAIGQEIMSALGIRRRLHNRQLEHHPTDDTKMVITGLKNRIYLH